MHQVLAAQFTAISKVVQALPAFEPRVVKRLVDPFAVGPLLPKVHVKR